MTNPTIPFSIPNTRGPNKSTPQFYLTEKGTGHCFLVGMASCNWWRELLPISHMRGPKCQHGMHLLGFQSVLILQSEEKCRSETFMEVQVKSTFSMEYTCFMHCFSSKIACALFAPHGNLVNHEYAYYVSNLFWNVSFSGLSWSCHYLSSCYVSCATCRTSGVSSFLHPTLRAQS